MAIRQLCAVHVRGQCEWVAGMELANVGEFEYINLKSAAAAVWGRFAGVSAQHRCMWYTERASAPTNNNWQEPSLFLQPR